MATSNSGVAGIRSFLSTSRRLDHLAVWVTALVTSVVAELFHPSTGSFISKYVSYFDGKPIPFPGNVGDAHIFVKGGDAILSGNYQQAYAFRDNIAGPLQMILDRVLVSVGNFIGFPVFAALLMAALTGALGSMVLWLSHERTSKTLFAALALPFIFLFLSIPNIVYTWGHWWHVPIAILWVFAGYYAQKGKWLLPGLFLAVSISLEPWGALAVLPVMLFSLSVRKAFGVAMISSVGVLSWLPFVLAPGGFTMGGYVWQGTRLNSLWGALGYHDFPWSLRFIQAALTVGITCFSLLLAKKINLNPKWASWFVMSSLLLLRVAFDVKALQYYWSAAAALLVLGLVLAAVEWDRLAFLLLLVATLLGTVPWQQPLYFTYMNPFLLAFLVCGLVTASVVVECQKETKLERHVITLVGTV